MARGGGVGWERLLRLRLLLRFIQDLLVSRRLFSDRPNPFPLPFSVKRPASANQIVVSRAIVPSADHSCIVSQRIKTQWKISP
ncbi:hypothetical protein TNCV_1238221 [Trichonephila clavipes]|nr:hypothetical protein TNCV_1238221 [Trichonephila clavipes]